jgi:hypothetical protein
MAGDFRSPPIASGIRAGVQDAGRHMHRVSGATAAVFLGIWLSSGVVHAQGGARVVVSEPVSLAAACGAKASEEGVHGGTQTRICRTSHGSYAAFLGKDAGGEVVIHLVRIRDGRPERLASLPTSLRGANGVQVVCDADQEVYVVAPGTVYSDGKERAVLTAYHVDRDTGATTEYRATVPFGSGRGFGYGVTFLDLPRRAIYALYSGGDAPGYLAWVRFDLDARRWADEAVVAEMPFRHCYSYGFSDGAGGTLILSERDIKVETAGIAPGDPGWDGHANYVWDELRVFHFPDLKRPEHRAVDVEAAVYDKPAGLYPNVQNNFGGDTFIDSKGRMHVLYRSTDNNRTNGSFNRQVVLDPSLRVVSNDLLPFQEGASMRMFQSKAGRHHIAAIPYDQPARIQAWGAVDAEGLRYELMTERRLGEGVRPSYAGLVLSSPRDGSIQDDVVDALFPSGHDFHHFSIRLK